MLRSLLTFKCLALRQDSIVVRNLGVSSVCSLKSNLPIKWNRPEKVACFHPDKSGDLRSLVELDKKNLRPLEFQNLEELETADETVKKMFTLEFFPAHKSWELIREKYKSMVRRHDFDVDSPEARISRMTAKIRYLQELLPKYPKNMKVKVLLKETIDKRKRLMLELREQDYKCFEYLLEKLDLEYKPYPPKTVFMRVERKRSMRMLTDEYCNKIVQSKLLAQKNLMESKKESFLLKKIDSLKWMMKEEKRCGVLPTVTENDVATVEEQLRDYRIKITEEKMKVKETEDKL